MSVFRLQIAFVNNNTNPQIHKGYFEIEDPVLNDGVKYFWYTNTTQFHVWYGECNR